jgi:hypothetical protein
MDYRAERYITVLWPPHKNNENPDLNYNQQRPYRAARKRKNKSEEEGRK